MSRRNDLSLVLDTVKKVRKRQDARGVLLYSDQEFQYTSRQYTNLLKRDGIQADMSRKRNCRDKASIENFFSHFKTECFYLHSFH
ncbi:DDE-type integrase/transposase/recombinase [Paenibacillus sp. CH40]|uniref:DDE-type integrase/transposase/recombinase n=1 Tax=Paenibacillus sp. CH40 TaxID=2962045 RepID=UPI00349F178F